VVDRVGEESPGGGFPLNDAAFAFEVHTIEDP